MGMNDNFFQFARVELITPTQKNKKIFYIFSVSVHFISIILYFLDLTEAFLCETIAAKCFDFRLF